MKKHLFCLISISIAISLSAFTKSPVKKTKKHPFLNYYRFTYLAPGGLYTNSNVSNPDSLHWGFGELVYGPEDFSYTCAQTTTLEKPCELIITETFLITNPFNGKTRMRIHSYDGPGYYAIINTISSAVHPNTYSVDPLSASLAGVQNRVY